MNGNRLQNKLKFRRLLVYTILIAFVFQITAVSMAQATSETIPRSNPVQPSPDDTVTVTNDEPSLISTQDVQVTTVDKGGELIDFDNSTIPREEEIEKNLLNDTTTIGMPEDDANEEAYKPLIAPQPQADNILGLLGMAVMFVAIAAVVAIVIVRRPKKSMQ